MSESSGLQLMPTLPSGGKGSIVQSRASDAMTRTIWEHYLCHVLYVRPTQKLWKSRGCSMNLGFWCASVPTISGEATHCDMLQRCRVNDDGLIRVSVNFSPSLDAEAQRRLS
jgi:hypothetical protein